MKSILLLAAFFLTLLARAEELTIAAASDLKFALDELVTEYRKTTPGAAIKVSYGASGNFHSQILNGAPYDLYFSADIQYPEKLAKAGHALDGAVFLYAVGHLVIWAPESSPIDVKNLGMRSLLDPSVRKISIANPRHAPYGAAALAALKSSGIHDAIANRLVLGENVAQAAHFIQSGAADIGIIALSLALAPPMKNGKSWEVPLDAYPKLEQGGMILNTTKSPAAAKAFRDFVLNQNGREVLKRYGFFLPEKND